MNDRMRSRDFALDPLLICQPEVDICSSVEKLKTRSGPVIYATNYDSDLPHLPFPCPLNPEELHLS